MQQVDFLDGSGKIWSANLNVVPRVGETIKLPGHSGQSVRHVQHIFHGDPIQHKVVVHVGDL